MSYYSQIGIGSHYLVEDLLLLCITQHCGGKDAKQFHVGKNASSILYTRFHNKSVVKTTFYGEHPQKNADLDLLFLVKRAGVDGKNNSIKCSANQVFH